MTKNTKNINIEINHECWKKLKIISIDRDITLQEVVRDILERATNKKVKSTNNNEE
jgi:macrodomain Ter protein organizer (MatP/YcbG family)